ncbi:hypothetical protein UT300013_18780 [Paraclostridium sordellii]
MGFFNECSYVLRKHNKDMIFINTKNNLYFNYMENSDRLLASKKITSTTDFSKYYFDIDALDTVYGIFIDKNINIVQFDKDLNEFSTIHKINYDYKNFNINFPYIKYIDNQIHILYYLSNNQHPTTILFHHYNNGEKWFENKIDFINLPLIDNYIISIDNLVPSVFYFKEDEDFPQVYTSTFNLSQLTWSKPVKITNSYSNKIYLSVLKDKLNFYHLSFCESFQNKYKINYINGYLNTNNFNTIINNSMTEPSLFLYPSLVKSDSKLYLSYVEQNRLYTKTSDDLGNTWSNCIEDPYSINEKFIRCYLKSNYRDDLDYNCSSLFATKNPFSILGYFE